MNQHGWNTSDRDCVGTKSPMFIFDSYIPQYALLNEGVKLVGSVSRIEGSIREEDQLVPDTKITLSNMTAGLKFEHAFSAELFEGPVKINHTAWEMYGGRMGLRMHLDSYGKGGLSQNQGMELFPEFKTHDFDLRDGTFVILKFGTAVILARANDVDSSGALLHLKEMSTNDLSGALEQNPWWQQTPWCREKDKLGVPLFLPRDVIMVCDETDKNGSLWCGDWTGNCTFMDSLGIGFAHRPHGRAVQGQAGPPTEPLQDLLGLVAWMPLDRGLNRILNQEFTDYGVQPKDLQAALDDVRVAAGSLLRKQLKAELVSVDSTRNVLGALLDLTVTIVAALAVATSYKDLEVWLASMAARVLKRDMPHKGVAMSANLARAVSLCSAWL